MKEVEISIKGLFFYILKHWMSIVVAMIIGAVALSGLKMVRANRNARTVVSNEAAGASLSDSERAYVESVYDYLNGLRQANENRKDSLIMRLNPENVVKAELTYVISVDDSDCLEGVEQAYRNFLISSDFTGYISSETGINNIDVEDTIIVSMNSERELSTNTTIGIVVIAEEKSEAENLVKIINAFMTQKSDALSKDGFVHAVNLIRNSIYQGPDLYVQNRQLQLLQEIQSRAKIILDAEETIKDTDKAYYDSLVNQFEISTEGNLNNDGIPQSQTAVKPYFKYAVLGAIIGFVFLCGIYSMVYIISNKLDEEDDTEELFGLYLIGYLSGKDYGKYLYKLRHLGKRTFDFEESVRLISTRIKMNAQRSEVSKIGIIGCGIKKNNDKAADEIVNALRTDGIDIELIDDPLYDPSSTEKLSGVDGVILLEKAGATYRTEIWKEIEMVKKLGIKNEGIIIAE